MKLFDSHCHLNDPSYANDLPVVVERAKSEGVAGMMIVGISPEESRQAVGIAERFSGCYASVGIHPHDAGSCTEEGLKFLKKLARNPKVKAWGETGLDFNRMYSPREMQEKWFVRQLETADELDLPLIFHERDSGGRFLDILTAHYGSNNDACPGVVHCFSGTPQELQAYLKMGFYIGITGILTIKQRGGKLRSMVGRIPSQRLVIETDAPFLTPSPEKNRSRRNEPAFVRHVLFKLAEVLAMEPNDLAETLWQNTCRLYGIPPSANINERRSPAQ